MVVEDIADGESAQTPTGIQSLKNLSFQLIPGVFYLQQVFWVYKFCTDLVVFDREREDNLYVSAMIYSSDRHLGSSTPTAKRSACNC